MIATPDSAHSAPSAKSLLLVALLALAANGWAADTHHAPDRHARHDAHPATPLTLNHGQQWPSDESLRQGMTNMRDAMSGALPAIHQGKLSTARYDALVKRLDGEVGFIVANCHLDKQADAQLHLVLVQLGEGMARMKGTHSAAEREDGARQVVHALNAYGQHFHHPGWRELAF